MGFDNECILNIQSLAGEYFCPVCRLLVYPNEALQSQCTHLYCKPCLTYVVSTTQACPYDGYLVTEADAKPLIESNKTLAETIGKVGVHCLYHRSGCTWQGPLSECTSHCSGCAFGNSPVVCNRCAIQIVHRQVQEHAQSCPGGQPQVHQAEGALSTSASGLSATSGQTNAATQIGAATSQGQASQTISATIPGSDPKQKANASSQAVVPSAEQWSQNQQQYQQYYQQYPGYDPYQQQYQNCYPYQQPAVPQSQQQHLQFNLAYGTVQQQPQSQPQTQPQQPQLSQSHVQLQPQLQPPNVQAPVPVQTQNQAQVNQQQQLNPALQTYPAVHGQPHSQAVPYFQAPSNSQPHPQHVQMPQYQLHPQHHPLSQPQPQTQLQTQTQLQQNPQLHPSQPMNATVQPQTQYPSSHAGNHLYPQPHLHQPMQPGAPQQHTMHMQSQGVLHSQSQTPVQIQSQFPQQRPPSSHATIPNQQQLVLLPSTGQVQNLNHAQQQPVHSYAQQSGISVHHRPLMPVVQQPIAQQHFHNQPYVQQQPHTQLRPHGQSHSFPQHIQASTQSQQNVAFSQGIQHTQSNLVGRPMMPSHGVQSQPYAQTSGGVPVRPMHPVANQIARKVEQDLGAASVVVADTEKTAKAEMDAKFVDDEHKPTSENKTNEGDTSSKEIMESRGIDSDPHALKNGESASKQLLKEEGVDRATEQSSNGKLNEVAVEGRSQKTPSKEAQFGREQEQKLQKDANGASAVSISAPLGQLPHAPMALPQRPGAPFVQLPPGPPHHTQGPGHSLLDLRPRGPAHIPGQAFHPSEHFQPPAINQGFGHEGPKIHGEPVGTPPFGSLAFAPRGDRMVRAPPFGSEGHRSQQRPVFPDERLNHFAIDPSRRVIDRVEFEDDLKQFPRPSYLDSDPVSKFGNYSSRPFDRGFYGPNTGMNTDRGVGTAASKFLSPYHLGGSVHGNDAVDIGRMEPSRGHPDFVGRHLMDGLAPRSPLRDYPGVPSHGFRGFGPEDFDGREFHRFGDPLGDHFHESRFPDLPSHFRRGEFQGPSNLRMVDHIRNDLIGQDGHPGHFQRGDHIGPPNLPGRLHLRESVGFGARHTRMGDMTGPGNFESFRGNRPSHPRLGEPGFRSSFSLQRFPNDRTFTGDLESFDHTRKRKPATMGWCRICKVDCETVEGLDLHSQTREHQKLAMDMVRSIKQNAKKQKLTSGDQSLVEDAKKSNVPVLRGGEKSTDC